MRTCEQKKHLYTINKVKKLLLQNKSLVQTQSHKILLAIQFWEEPFPQFQSLTSARRQFIVRFNLSSALIFADHVSGLIKMRVKHQLFAKKCVFFADANTNVLDLKSWPKQILRHQPPRLILTLSMHKKGHICERVAWEVPPVQHNTLMEWIKSELSFNLLTFAWCFAKTVKIKQVMRLGGRERITDRIMCSSQPFSVWIWWWSQHWNSSALCQLIIIASHWQAISFMFILYKT